MFTSIFNKRSLTFDVILVLFITSFHATSCSDAVNKEESQETITELRIGAVYISCEPTPWQFNFTDLLSCEQEAVATLELNPENACPMSDIQISDGQITVSFSDDLNTGRIKVNVSADVVMQDAEGNEVAMLYLNDSDFLFLSQNDILLKLKIENAYVGNCYHELIRWEELNPNN